MITVLLSALLFFLPSTPCSASASQQPFMHFNIAPEVMAKNSLKEFLKLSAFCRYSAQNTTDKQAFDSFKKINTFYLEHRADFKNLKKLSDEQSIDLAGQAKYVLADALQSVAPTRAAQVLTPSASLKDGIDHYKQNMPQLLTMTPTNTTIKRIGLFTLIETVFLLLSNALTAPPVGTQRPRKHVPEFGDRFKALAFSGVPAKEMARDFAAILVPAIGKTLCKGAVNEWVKKGLPSYTERVSEGLIPPIIATIITFVMLSGTRYLNKSFLLGRAITLLNLIVLQKAFLKASHFLYKPLLFTSYLFPFVINTTTKTALGKESLLSNKILFNSLFEGSMSALLFNALPAGVEKTMPKRSMAWNPRHRRALVKKLVQDVFNSALTQWNNQAFTASA